MLHIISGLWLGLAAASTLPDAAAPSAPPAVASNTLDVPAPSAAGPLPVARTSTLNLPVPRRASVSVRYLPAGLGVELDVPLDLQTVEAALGSLDDSLEATARATEIGTRVVVVGQKHEVRATLQRTTKAAVLRLGSASEEHRLRGLASLVALPLPEPPRLGAYLELWHEAELALGEGELRRALELWQRLEGTTTVADLAALRIAELFILSGHVNEARARLSAVSRRHPRSNGAALARLDLLHLDALSDDQRPTTEHVVFSAESLEGRSFGAYGWFRATAVLAELGRAADALEHFPKVNGLPASWRDRAAALRQQLVAEAICAPALHGDPVGTAVAYRQWMTDLADHPRRAAILRHTVAALTSLGLYADVHPIARELLREGPSRVDEADLVLSLAAAYVGTKDEVRALEVVRFAAKEHPQAPAVLPRIRGLAAMTLDAHGLSAAQEFLADLGTRKPSLLPALLSHSSDLALAHGSPLVVAQTLALSKKAGFDDPAKRAPQLAIALARVGRARDAAPMLRTWIGKTTDPELRDRMAYHLADVEQALGHDADAAQILETIAGRGTTYGQIANVRVQERKLEGVLSRLETPAPQRSAP